MLNVVLAGQYVAIGILFFGLLYIAFQRPGKLQLILFVLNLSAIILFVGYSVELCAQNVDTAMTGVAISYIGKPFALLSCTLFIATFCEKTIPKKVTFYHAIFHAIFPIIVFTNDFHHLYYATVLFDRSREFSPLILTHGPLYYLYVATLAVHMIYDTVLTAREYRNASNGIARVLTGNLFWMIACSYVGYALFISGLSGGYDATIAGIFIGTLILTSMFVQYNLFDYLTLAKEHALDTVANGLLVYNSRDQMVYSNNMVSSLVKKGITTIDALKGMPIGKSILNKDEKVYEVNKKQVVQNGMFYGEIIEVSDITESFLYSARLEHDVEERTKEIQHIQRQLATSFAGLIEARDSNTGVHVKRLSRIVEILCDSLVAKNEYKDILTDEYITMLVDVCPLHDIGKLSIPDSILLKPGPLTDEEYEIMKTHTIQGAKIIEECFRGVESEEYVQLAEDIVLYHHECWDGSGYSSGLAGQDIPLCARIIAVADVYDALRSDRCYKDAYSADESREIIVSGKGTHFDPVVVDAFLRSFKRIERM